MVDSVTCQVDPAVLSYFSTPAEKILAAYGDDACKALSACLAVICNTTKPLPARSLLSANEGFITMLFRTPSPIHNVGKMFREYGRRRRRWGYGIKYLTLPPRPLSFSRICAIHYAAPLPSAKIRRHKRLAYDKG